MKIAVMSDVHGEYGIQQNKSGQVVGATLDPPEADLLLMAGDLLPNFAWGKFDGGLQCGYLKQQFAPMLELWKAEGRYKEIVVVAGNHDWCFQYYEKLAREHLSGVVYLQDEQFTYEGVKIWGSPWQPWFWDWAFNFPNHHENYARYRAHARGIWEMVPDDIDILVTHGPPQGIRDETLEGMKVGCQFLRERVDELTKLRLHVFGHIHPSYGQEDVNGALFVNAAICGKGGLNPVQVLDWDCLTKWDKLEKEHEDRDHGSPSLGEEYTNPGAE